MKTPEQVALERVAKASEQMVRAVNDLTKSLEKQNQIILAAFQAMPIYRDVEDTRPEKAPQSILKDQ